MILLGLLLMPFIIGMAATKIFDSTITWKEYLLMTAISSIIAFAGYKAAQYGAMQDVEHWNGHITAKRHGKVSCCHCWSVCDSYDKDGFCDSSHEECSHNRDWYWHLDVSSGDVLGPSCVHEAEAPGWYQKAYVNEPAAVERTYKNYLKADPESLMTKEAEKYLDQVPNYPSIHGMYHVKRVISKGVKPPSNWQKDLDEMNKYLGPLYQIDILVILTDNKDPDFAKSVEAKWLYGPKNAVTIIIGSPDKKTIGWARAISLSNINAFKIEIRDGLPGKSLDDPSILPFVKDLVKKQYSRTPMSDFEYLASDIQPTEKATWILYILNFFVIIGLIVLMHKQDLFGDEKWIRQVTRWKY